ncbi:MAG: hypothetical protein ACOH2E_01450 [Candidatus Paracaedibacter sp.]
MASVADRLTLLESSKLAPYFREALINNNKLTLEDQISLTVAANVAQRSYQQYNHLI